MKSLSEQQILEYADKYSRIYIAKYGESVMLEKDDALSVAYIALRENSSYDETCSNDEIESLIRIRVTGALTRHYQSINGVRRKNRASFVSLDDCEYEVAKKKAKNGDISIKEAVELSLSRLADTKKIDVIKAILNGEKRGSVAKANHISCGRVTQIFQEFKDCVARVLEN